MVEKERDESPFIIAIIVGLVNYIVMMYVIANEIFGMDENISIIAIVSIIIPILFLRDLIGHLIKQ